MATDSQKQRTCSECGSTEIVAGIAVSLAAVSGEIGLSYKSLGILRASAPMFADLCSGCGTIVRLYVRDAHKPWLKI
jgi:hypothetical protein